MIVLVAAISPFRAGRDAARELADPAVSSRSTWTHRWKSPKNATSRVFKESAIRAVAKFHRHRFALRGAASSGSPH